MTSDIGSADDDGAGGPEAEPYDGSFAAPGGPPLKSPSYAPGFGSLVLVATPIGNLGDLSPRAATLAAADTLYCEDTRHTRKLLTHAGITGVSLRSLHEHNEESRISEVIDLVASGHSVAVVSDAGMPGISDPGSRVVAAVAGRGMVVSVVPGPSAALGALVVSGLPTDRFCFEGFLPRSGRERRARLEDIAAESRTVVLYESPVRTRATLEDLAAVCGGGRMVAVVRELTKLHEEVWRGPVSEAVLWAMSKPIRGEVVIVVTGAPEVAPPEISDAQLEAAVRVRLAAGERTRGAVDSVAAEFGVARRRVYDLALTARSAHPED